MKIRKIKEGELEPKYIAPYLPYGVYIIPDYPGNKDNSERVKLRKLSTIESHYRFKLLLRPLSDLIKDDWLLKTLGENYSSIKCEYHEYTLSLDVSKHESINLLYRIGAINKLFEHHFDVFGLIEKGLAVDVNTLKLSHYEQERYK